MVGIFYGEWGVKMTIHTGLKFKTSTPIIVIEDWLEDNCKGDWDLDIEAIATRLGQKSIAIYFESDVDKNAFKTAYKTLK